MSERRYYDLFAEISRMTMPQDERVGIATALRWLDEHPDQVPGRTITRSEYHETLNGAVKVSGYGDDWERGFNTGLVVSGTKVVPDPEPSNAEKLKALCSDWTIGRNCLEDEDLSDYLDRLGVKAPGGDDDQ